MKKHHYFLASVMAAAAALFVAIGIFRMVNIYHQYRSDMLAYESRHLNSIVSTSSRGISWMIEGYKNQTAELVDRVDFRYAEDIYLESGDTALLQRLVSHPDILKIGLQCKLVIYDQTGQVVVATDNEFPLYRFADIFLGNDIVLRWQNGAYWLVFGHNSDLGLHYELALSVQSIFSAHADSARIGENGYVFLMDRYGRFVALSSGGKTMTYSMEAFTLSFPDADMTAISELLTSQGGLPEDYYVYEYPWLNPETGETEMTETLVSVFPVDVGSPSGMVMGAAISFREFHSFLTEMMDKTIGVIALEIAGAMLLVALICWFMYRNRRYALEMHALKEKTELMEEINRQQQSLQHSARLQQLGVMTSGIAHEFNNLMTPIMGQSLLLLENLADQEDSPQFECALDIYEASEKARSIIKGMSVMSKKNVDMHFKSVEISEFMEKTLSLAAMAKNPHIHQQLVVAAEEPLFVAANEQLLAQAFMNLFINGYQAMGEEGRLLVTIARESRSGGDYVRVDVRDSGPGIPQHKLGQIYDEFYTTKGEQGTGLGLVICQKIVETHKGTIAVANHPEGGAVFTVRLPMADYPEE